MNSQQFARRWRKYNPSSPGPYPSVEEEDAWREEGLEWLSNLHTLGGIDQAVFEVVDSHFSDLSLGLDHASFKWRWEANSVGYRSSAEIISKHLVIPLITANSLALSSPESIGEMADSDVEKAVDKSARVARRHADTHVRNALSKPKAATILRRITAMFNFATELPPILSVAQKPDLEPRLQVEPQVKQPPPSHPSPPPLVAREAPSSKATADIAIHGRRMTSESPPPQAARQAVPSPARSDMKGKDRAAVPVGSETEDSDDEQGEGSAPVSIPKGQGTPSPPAVNAAVLTNQDIRMHSPSPPPPSIRKQSLSPPPASAAASSKESPAPERKSAKKPRVESSSNDSDSDAGSKGRAGSRVPARRGAKQPMKRGGKRF
ncbi:hypothetical protein CC1G_06399 [Coprinopsis cinerea okayama7|uniref:Uncharacterized protein n=1 Tax=Coprinopsis cinerea (strain Okayama-7 / 130 / ATCC MYA-4618 / FGSC 9003) TaxID=240176 RepID=A8NTV8_COPC7|nr:hypothetical protein CC1G_06399 [Coprinopsis cinerea okayama7\|eukprot:XP_001836314.1 hypothetical protein CC1G_06399 [Coprinopsis cinerea okayama7\